HDEVLARVVEVELAHALDHREVLVGDRGDRDVGDLDLALLDEEQQEIERPLEEIELDATGRAHVGPSPIALRTSPIVASAISRARRLPASSTARASSVVSFARRSRMGARSAMTCLIMTFL